MLVLWHVGRAPFIADVAVDGTPTSDLGTHLVGIGGMVVGLVPLFPNRLWRCVMAAADASRAAAAKHGVAGHAVVPLSFRFQISRRS